VICAKDIRKEYREAGALNELIGIYAAVDEHTFLTKSGHVLQALRVQGADQECLDPAQLDYIARRFEAAMRIFPASFRIYQILLKRDHAPLPHEEHRNRMMREAIRNRIEYLEAKAADLYTLDLFFVIEYEANLGNRSASALQRPVETIAKWFSETKTLCVLEEHLTRAVAALATKVNSFLVQLRDLVGMELLRVEDAFQVFAWLLNYAPYKSDCLPLHSYEDIDWQLASSALEWPSRAFVAGQLLCTGSDAKRTSGANLSESARCAAGSALELRCRVGVEARRECAGAPGDPQSPPASSQYEIVAAQLSELERASAETGRDAD
jgi:hypothetical protein